MMWRERGRASEGRERDSKAGAYHLPFRNRQTSIQFVSAILGVSEPLIDFYQWQNWGEDIGQPALIDRFRCRIYHLRVNKV